LDEVLVQDAQMPEAHVPRVVVVGERERVPGVEPPVVGVAALGGRADGDHGRQLKPSGALWQSRGMSLPAADSDLHVLEPADLWQRYIDPAYRHAAPVGLTEMPRDMRVKVKSHVVLRLGRVRPMRPGDSPWSEEQSRLYAHAEARGWDSTSQ